MKLILLNCVLLCLSFVSFGQITVTNTLTPQELVEQVLVGTGVTPTNITVNGSAANATNIQVSASYFNQNGTSFPINEGVLLSTGQGSVAVGPNDAAGDDNNIGSLLVTDADMNSISAASVTNGIIIEFDFVATGNQLEFDYIFGSEEYPEFAPPNSSSYNDVFGFFLSGPGIAGPYSNGAINLAQIPGTTTPVSINNVNEITNPNYYVDNVAGNAFGSAIQYDGTTVTMTAFSELQCSQTYHIKLGIANVGDEAWDSGVFLKGGSFTVNPVGFNFDTYTVDNTIYESCDQLGTIMFTREGCNIDLGQTLTAYTFFSGQADNGIDYQTLPDSVFFDVGEDTLYWQLIPIQDLLNEGIESVDITIMSINSTGDTIYSYGTFYISDNPPLVVTTTDDLILCVGDDATLSVAATGLTPLTYQWNDPSNSTSTSITVPSSANGSYDYIVTVTDFCGTEVVDTAVMVVNQTLAFDNIISGPTTCDPTGYVSAIVSGDSTNASHGLLYNWNGPGATNPNNWNASVWTNLGGGWYYIEVEDAVCNINDSIFVPTDNVPVAEITPTYSTGCGPLAVTFDNSSQNSNTYYWNFGNGNTLTVTDLSSQSQSYAASATVQLIASNGNANCNDTTYAVVDIPNCGCTDPTALNYDPNAVIDNGSCDYPVPPIPTVVVPNVFTPNSDLVNNVFVLTVENAEYVQMTIVNRWGNVVYDGAGDMITMPKWDGTTPNGNQVEDGVYFVKYTVRGAAAQEINGHGFVQVVR